MAPVPLQYRAFVEGYDNATVLRTDIVAEFAENEARLRERLALTAELGKTAMAHIDSQPADKRSDYVEAWREVNAIAPPRIVY